MVEIVSVVEAEPLDGRVSVVELRDTCGPLGDTATVSDTEPEKPLRLVSVRAAEPLEPVSMVRAAGLDAELKSGVALALGWTTMLPIILLRCIEQKYV